MGSLPVGDHNNGDLNDQGHEQKTTPNDRPMSPTPEVADEIRADIKIGAKTGGIGHREQAVHDTPSRQASRYYGSPNQQSTSYASLTSCVLRIELIHY